MDNMQETIESLFTHKPNENIRGLLTGKKSLFIIEKKALNQKPIHLKILEKIWRCRSIKINRSSRDEKNDFERRIFYSTRAI